MEKFLKNLFWIFRCYVALLLLYISKKCSMGIFIAVKRSEICNLQDNWYEKIEILNCNVEGFRVFRHYGSSLHFFRKEVDWRDLRREQKTWKFPLEKIPRAKLNWNLKIVEIVYSVCVVYALLLFVLLNQKSVQKSFSTWISPLLLKYFLSFVISTCVNFSFISFKHFLLLSLDAIMQICPAFEFFNKELKIPFLRNFQFNLHPL